MFNSITPLFHPPCASLSLLLKINAERNHAVRCPINWFSSVSLRVQKSPTRWHLRVLLRDRVLFSKHRAANNNNKLVRRANVKGTSSLFHYSGERETCFETREKRKLFQTCACMCDRGLIFPLDEINAQARSQSQPDWLPFFYISKRERGDAACGIGSSSVTTFSNTPGV